MTDFTCKVDEDFRSACKNLTEYQRTGYCVLHFPDEDKKDGFREAVKEKLIGEDYDFRGVFFPEGMSSFRGFTFTEFADFSSATFNGRADFNSATFNRDGEFSSATFNGDAFFHDATFSEKANFPKITVKGTALFFETTFGGEATFDSAIFEKVARFHRGENASTTFVMNASFLSARFAEDALFFDATFSEDADFRFAIFGGKANFRKIECNGSTCFGDATFNQGADFSEAIFMGEANFVSSTFDGDAQFLHARFTRNVLFHTITSRGAMEFAGDGVNLVFSFNTRVNFINARMERPDLVFFSAVRLRPSWFIMVDARQWHFTDVRWFGLSDGPAEGALEKEIEAIREQTGQSRYAVLAKTCSNLSINVEQNHDYPLANELHYWSMEAQRKGMPRSGFAVWKLIWWYWALSGYGERHVRAGMWLLAVLVGCAALYLWVGPVGIEEHSLASILQTTPEALTFSLGVMTRLAKNIPQSASTLVTSLIIIEGVLGPLLIGLFLLALRRKFMR